MTRDDVFTIIGAIAALIFLLFFGVWITMLLWNGLVVPLFGAPILSFWQTFGLIIMVRFITPNITIKKNS